MDHIFRYAVAHAGLPFLDAVRAAVRQTSTIPAAVLGLDDVGQLTPGRRADLVVLDGGLQLRAVMRAGDWIQPPIASS